MRELSLMACSHLLATELLATERLARSSWPLFLAFSMTPLFKTLCLLISGFDSVSCNEISELASNALAQKTLGSRAATSQQDSYY